MDAQTESEEDGVDDKQLTVLAIWQRGQHVYEMLCSPEWHRRHFDELNLPDRHAFINLCADLALMQDARAGLLYHEKINLGLSTPMSVEISREVGSAILYRCIESQRAAVPLLALDLMAMHHADLSRRNAVQAESLITNLSEKLFEAFLTRREHFGFGLDLSEGLQRWSEARREPFLLSLAKLTFTEFRLYEDESDREDETDLANTSLDWSMLYLQERSKVFEQGVRVALGKFILDLANEYKLLRLPAAAMTFVVVYLDDVCATTSGRPRRKIIREELLGLQDELKQAIKTNLYATPTEEGSELRSTD